MARAGVAISLLLWGCARAGFEVPGRGPSDSAAETSVRESGAVDHGVVEAARPDMPQGCALQAPSHRWSQRVGAVGRDYGVGVAIDVSGNVYLTGMFTGTASFGGETLTSKDGSADAFVASYTDKGVLRWVKHFGGAGEDSGESVAIDASGNIYVTGGFTGTASFGGGEVASEGASLDAFVVSFSGAGAYRWSRRFGGASSDSGSGVAVDGGGNVYLIGSFRATAEIGPASLVSKGASDTYVAAYSAGGAHRWAKGFGGAGEDYGSAVAVDGSGNVTATGRFFGSVTIGGGTLSSAGQDDIYLVSYTSAGIPRWRKRVGGPGQDVPFDLVADSGGNVFVTGRFEASVDFGGGTDTKSNGGSDIFVASYSATSAYRWARGIGGKDDDAGRRLAVDGAGNVFLAAVYHGTADPGGGLLTSKGGGDVLAASYTSTGAPCWQRSFGDADDEAGYGVAVHGSGQVVLAGWFYKTLDLGGTTLTSAGDMDIFVAGFSP